MTYMDNPLPRRRFGLFRGADRCGVSPAQRERDRNGLRNVCAACGIDGTAIDPLVVDVGEGMRVCHSHFDDPGTGYYGQAWR